MDKKKYTVPYINAAAVGTESIICTSFAINTGSEEDTDVAWGKEESLTDEDLYKIFLNWHY